MYYLYSCFVGLTFFKIKSWDDVFIFLVVLFGWLLIGLVFFSFYSCYIFLPDPFQHNKRTHKRVICACFHIMVSKGGGMYTPRGTCWAVQGYAKNNQ